MGLQIREPRMIGAKTMSDATTTPQKKTSGLAVAGLVLGILAAVTSFLPIINNLSFFIALVGLILALVALIGAVKGKNSSKGMAIAGVVLGVISIIVVLVTQAAYSSALKSVSENLETSSAPVSVSDSAEPAAAADQSQEAETAPEQDFSHLAIGQAATYDNGLTVVVNEVERGLVSYDDSIKVRVNVTYTNNGDKKQSFGSWDWDGEDANGAQRSTSYYSEAVDELNSGSLAPGGTVSGNLYFDDGIVRVVYTENMFSSNSETGWDI